MPPHLSIAMTRRTMALYGIAALVAVRAGILSARVQHNALTKRIPNHWGFFFSMKMWLSNSEFETSKRSKTRLEFSSVTTFVEFLDLVYYMYTCVCCFKGAV